MPVLNVNIRTFNLESLQWHNVISWLEIESPWKVTQAGQKKWTQARSREVRRRKKSFPCSTVWSQRIWGYLQGAFSAEQVPGLPARDWQIILQLDRTAAMFPLSLVPRPMYRTSDGSQEVKSGISPFYRPAVPTHSRLATPRVSQPLCQHGLGIWIKSGEELALSNWSTEGVVLLATLVGAG